MRLKTLAGAAVSAALAIAATFTPLVSAEAGQSTFYLNSKAGCYSFATPAEEGYAIEGSRYKLLFRGSCEDDHHIQIIYSGPIKTKNGATATEEQVYKACATYYKKVVGGNPPSTIQNKKPYLRYWWPDAGLETLKYNNKIVCYVHQSDKTYTNYAIMIGGY
ncbi:MAG: hypothetical protein ORN27_11470 [Rhodoluna sp.]|nr:hypothetical protein [Rhodoluna sp.]